METDPQKPCPRRQLRWSGHTDVGRFRPNNEDSFLLLDFNQKEVRLLGKDDQSDLRERDFIFAVSDGMGGAKSGEFASKIALEHITRLLPTSFGSAASGMQRDYANILSEVFDRIHKSLLYLGSSYDECAGMGATLTLIWVEPAGAHFAHIGDSRLYYLQPHNGLRQLTDDHSHVGWLRRTGQINEREQRTHPRRNVIAKALGAGHRYAEPQIGSVRWSAGDQFLLCSDGLIDGLWDRGIEELIRHPNAAQAACPVAQRLTREAVRASGRDNATAVVVEICETFEA